MQHHFVVVGAGQAGASLVAKLRTEGFDGRITLIGSEPVPPYQRPPLSKKYLLGEIALERLYLRPREFYAANGVELRLGTAVSRIDRQRKTVELSNETVGYDKLVLATGSVPLHLPAAMGGALKGVHVVRTLADVDALAPEIRPGRSVLIIGGGYIGLEVAAVTVRKGLRVTVVEQAERILNRVSAAETAAYFRELHRSHGVDLREKVAVQRLDGEQHVERVRLSDGSAMPVDFVILGIGVRPADDLAAAAGLEIENGVRTDEYGQTSDASIFAAGDCASFPHEGSRIRLESVPHAIDHAEMVAMNMLGARQVYVPRPWFWSDQYDVKLQIAGLNAGYDSVISRPGARPDSVSFWYYRGPKLLAVDASNDPRAYTVAKRLIEAGESPLPEAVSDPKTELRSLLAVPE
jgi:3-phenylpropionate/trans-cinnamate dioxygenase ferredoxin reductase subunit